MRMSQYLAKPERHSRELVNRTTRPTRRTWMIFLILLAMNLVAPFLGFLLLNTHGTYSPVLKVLVDLPVVQVVGLVLLADWLGVPIGKGGGYIPTPTAYDWVLIVLSIAISLLINFTLAAVLARLTTQKRSHRQ